MGEMYCRKRATRCLGPRLQTQNGAMLFLVCFYLSLWPNRVALTVEIWDKDLANPSLSHNLAFLESKVAHPHILSGNWMQRGEGARGLSKPHTSRYLGWFGYFLMKRKTGCWGASIQEIEAKLSLRSEEASFIARLYLGIKMEGKPMIETNHLGGKKDNEHVVPRGTWGWGWLVLYPQDHFCFVFLCFCLWGLCLFVSLGFENPKYKIWSLKMLKENQLPQPTSLHQS